MNTIELRARLQITQKEFARLVGADVRSVARWEASTAKPCGSSRMVIAVFAYFLENRPELEAEFRALLTGYVRLWGLAFMLADLMNRLLADGEERKSDHMKKDA